MTDQSHTSLPENQGPDGQVPDVTDLLSEASRTWVRDQAVKPPLPLGELPFADELLSEQSRAWVRERMAVAPGTLPAGELPSSSQSLSPVSTPAPPSAAALRSPLLLSELPFADELLSERSKAWVRGQMDAASSSGPGSNPTDATPPNIDGYRVGRRIGRGGMGTVYECSREGSPDRLAIKIISAGRFAAEEERRRFMSEIGMLLRLHHPNISRLRDFGQHGAVAWFVMDLIAGRSFSEWVAETKPDFRAVAALLGHAARAVAHAHRQGIIHRDLNPANLMVLPDGHPVIMDFGLARDLASDEVLTISGMTVGTPPYMSPEQTLGSKGVLSIRTDVWGMGGILYHGLTGRAPYSGASNHEIYTNINEQDPLPPRMVVPTVPVDLERITLRCLQREPADRYPDLDALAADLERFAAGQRVGVRLPGLFTRLQRRVRHRPLPWILAAALVLVGCGFLGYAAVEQVRRLAAWTTVADATFASGRALPVGLAPRDGFFQPLMMGFAPDARGLGPVTPITNGQAGWWWYEASGLRGGVRLELELDMPVNDALEVAVNAAADRPRESWNHPAGWVVKIQSAEVLSLAVVYQDIPGPLQVDNGFLGGRPVGSTSRMQVTVEVRETSCTVSVAGSTPVTVNEPLALGGSDRRAIGIRFYSPQTRLRQLHVERLAAPELVSPLAGPDALLRHGLNDEAVAEYRLVAADHLRSVIGGEALLRAFAVRCRQLSGDDPLRNELYAALRARGPGPLLDEADRVRAVALWAAGQPDLALGVAHDLVERRPDLNPVQAFLGDRTWAVSPTVGGELVRLLAATPNSVGVALGELGLSDLAALAGRRAWSVNVAGNQLTDLTPVANSGCTYLNAARNRISDLRPLFGMRALVRLNLADNQIADVTPLAVLPALRILDLSGNQVTTLAGLPTSLVDLSVGKNPLTALSGLPVAALQRLNVAQTPITDLAPLQAATQLNQLDISETPVVDATALSSLPLGWLKALRATVFDPATLGATSLKRLQLAGCPLAVPQRLQPQVLAGLQILDLSDTPTTQWPAMAASELRELLLTNCQLTEVGGLAGLGGLTRLDLRGNRLVDASGLAGLHQLTRLDLRDNRLGGLGELLATPPAVLLVTGNPLTPAACRELISAGLRDRRSDLMWQGASLLCELHGETRPLRGVLCGTAAVSCRCPCGGHPVWWPLGRDPRRGGQPAAGSQPANGCRSLVWARLAWYPAA